MKRLSEYLTVNESELSSIKPVNKEELIDIINQRIEEYGPKCDLNDIDVSRVKDMSNLFENSEFDGDISRWDVSRVVDMRYMFWNSKFDGDISKWDTSNVRDISYMFYNSPLSGKEPSWYKK